MNRAGHVATPTAETGHQLQGATIKRPLQGVPQIFRPEAVMPPAPKRFEKMVNSAYLAGRTRTIVARIASAELP